MATISITTHGEFQGTKQAGLPAKCQEELVENQVVTFKGKRGSQIVALKGNLWVTQQGDPVDYLIRTGESISLERKGKVVVQGLSVENCFMMI
jgi:hypothetical protein